MSATDLVGHLAGGHLTVLHGRVSTGGLAKPERDDPELAILQTRGLEHEDRLAGQFQRSPFRSWDLDLAAFVLLDVGDYRPVLGIPVDVARAHAKHGHT